MRLPWNNDKEILPQLAMEIEKIIQKHLKKEIGLKSLTFKERHTGDESITFRNSSSEFDVPELKDRICKLRKNKYGQWVCD